MAGYNKDINYEDLIQKAAKAGDYLSAAQYEQLRNDKIIGEGLNYKTTNRYAGNLDTTDYGTQLRTLMDTGADADTVYDVLQKRVNKASSAINLKPYVNDALYQTAAQYIKTKNNAAPQFKSRYSSTIDDLVGKILNGTFEDYMKSPEYASLSSEYSANGKKAMQDTMGDVAARTGGLASSYAVTAGQQADNAFMQQLQDVARQMYSDQQSQNYNKLSAIEDLDNTDYSRFRDTVSDKQNADETLYERQSSIAKTMAGIGDYSGLRALGYTDAQIKALTDDYKAKQAAAAAAAVKKTTSSGRSKSGSGSKAKSSSTPDTSTAPTTTTKSGRIPAGLKSGMARNLWALTQTSGFSKEVIANRIGVAYDAGKITDAEADILLKLIGG
jgi:hypothetical protein